MLSTPISALDRDVEVPNWWRDEGDERALPDQQAEHAKAHVHRVLKLLSPAKPGQFSHAAPAAGRRDTRDQASSVDEAGHLQGHANRVQADLHSSAQEADRPNKVELLTPAPELYSLGSSKQGTQRLPRQNHRHSKGGTASNGSAAGSEAGHISNAPSVHTSLDWVSQGVPRMQPLLAEGGSASQLSMGLASPADSSGSVAQPPPRIWREAAAAAHITPVGGVGKSSEATSMSSNAVGGGNISILGRAWAGQAQGKGMGDLTPSSMPLHKQGSRQPAQKPGAVAALAPVESTPDSLLGRWLVPMHTADITSSAYVGKASPAYSVVLGNLAHNDAAADTPKLMGPAVAPAMAGQHVDSMLGAVQQPDATGEERAGPISLASSRTSSDLLVQGAATANTTYPHIEPVTDRPPAGASDTGSFSFQDRPLAGNRHTHATAAGTTASPGLDAAGDSPPSAASNLDWAVLFVSPAPAVMQAHLTPGYPMPGMGDTAISSTPVGRRRQTMEDAAAQLIQSVEQRIEEVMSSPLPTRKEGSASPWGSSVGVSAASGHDRRTSKSVTAPAVSQHSYKSLTPSFAAQYLGSDSSVSDAGHRGPLASESSDASIASSELSRPLMGESYMQGISAPASPASSNGMEASLGGMSQHVVLVQPAGSLVNMRPVEQEGKRPVVGQQVQHGQGVAAGEQTPQTPQYGRAALHSMAGEATPVGKGGQTPPAVRLTPQSNSRLAAAVAVGSGPTPTGRSGRQGRNTTGGAAPGSSRLATAAVARAMARVLQLSRQNSELEAAASHLEAQLTLAEEEREWLGAQVTAAAADQERLQQQLAHEAGERARLATALTAAEAAAASAVKAQAEAEGLVASLRRQLDEAAAEGTASQAAAVAMVQGAEAEVEEAHRGLRAAERTAQLEAARADQAQAQLESAKQEMQQLKDMLQEASSEAAHAKEVAAEREGSGEAERARLARQVWELTEKLGQQQREVEVAHEDASQLRRALEAATAEHTLAIQVHAAELSTACQQAERSADEAASAKQEVAALQLQLERLPEYEAELEAVAHRLESAQLEGHRLMEQVAEVEGLRAALEAAHNRSELQQQRIEALSAEVAAAHAQLSEAQEEAVHLAAALAVAQSDSQDLAATRDDLQRQVVALKEQLAQSRHTGEDAQDQHTRLSAQLIAKERDIAALRQMVEDLQGQVEQPQQSFNRNMGALEATGHAALFTSPSKPHAVPSIFKPTVQPALLSPLHTPSATPGDKSQHAYAPATPGNTMSKWNEGLSTQLVEIRFHVRQLQELAATWASDLGGQAAVSAANMLHSSTTVAGADNDQAHPGGQLPPSFSTPVRRKHVTEHTHSGEATAEAAWAQHTLEEIQELQAAVFLVLHACLSQAAPAAAAQLQAARASAGGAHQQLAARLAQAAAAAAVANNSKDQPHADAAQYAATQGTSATSKAFAELQAQCSEYEAQLAALQQRLAAAAQSEEAARQDALDAKSALEAERRAVSAAHEQLEVIRRELASAAQLQGAGGTQLPDTKDARLAAGSAGSSPEGEGTHISRAERRVQALEAQQAFVAHLQSQMAELRAVAEPLVVQHETALAKIEAMRLERCTLEQQLQEAVEQAREDAIAAQAKEVRAAEQLQEAQSMLRDAMARHQDEVAGLQGALTEAQQELQALQLQTADASAAHEASIHDLQQALAEAQQALQQAMSSQSEDLASHNAEVAGLEQALVTARQDLQSATVQYAAALETKEAEVHNLQQSLRSAQHELQQAVVEASQARQAVAALRQEMEETEQVALQMHSQVNTQQQEAAAQSRRALADSAEELASARQAAALQAQQLEAAQQEVVQARALAAAVREEGRALRRRAEAAEEGRNRAEDHAQQLQKALGEAEDRISQVLDRASAAELRAVGAESDLTAAHERAELLASALEAAREALVLHKSDHAAATEAEAQWRSRVAAAEQGHAEAVAKLKEAQQQTAALEARYKEAVSQVDEAHRALAQLAAAREAGTSTTPLRKVRRVDRTPLMSSPSTASVAPSTSSDGSLAPWEGSSQESGGIRHSDPTAGYTSDPQTRRGARVHAGDTQGYNAQVWHGPNDLYEEVEGRDDDQSGGEAGLQGLVAGLMAERELARELVGELRRRSEAAEQRLGVATASFKSMQEQQLVQHAEALAALHQQLLAAGDREQLNSSKTAAMQTLLSEVEARAQGQQEQAKAALQQQEAQAQQAVDALAKEMSVLREELDWTQAALREAEEQASLQARLSDALVAQLRQAVEAAEGRARAAEQQQEQLAGDLADALARAVRALERADAAEHRSQEAAARVAELQGKLAAAVQQATQTGVEVAQLRAALGEAQRIASAATVDAEAAEQKAASLEAMLEEAHSIMERAQQQAAEEAARLQARLAGAESSAAAASERVAMLEAHAVQLEIAAQQALSLVEQEQSEVARLTTALAESEEGRTSENRRSEALSDQVAKMQVLQQAAQGRVEELERDLHRTAQVLEHRALQQARQVQDLTDQLSLALRAQADAEAGAQQARQEAQAAADAEQERAHQQALIAAQEGRAAAQLARLMKELGAAASASADEAGAQGQLPGLALDLSEPAGGSSSNRAPLLDLAIYHLQTLREQNRKMARILKRISRQGNVLQQLDEARQELKELLVKYTASQLSVQQLQRALARLRDENESLTRLVTGLHEQQSQGALLLANHASSH